MNGYSDVISAEAELDDLLTTPTDEVIQALAGVEGDLLILGVGGKMGPTLARLAIRAIEKGHLGRRVIGVSRFSTPEVQRGLRAAGVETIGCDLLDDDALNRLPDVANVIFMAGRKFGSTGAESLTWAMNAYLPARVARRYRDSRLVVFSTGNVYPLVPVASGGATEDDPPGPVGEYAQSCLGRERLVEHFSRQHGTPAVIVRLNYAIDLRYGVLLDVAQKVWAGQPIDVRMGNVNVIWQGDANRAVLRCLPLAASPPPVLNLTGPETVSIRQVAQRVATLLGRPAPEIVGEEAPTALLSNAARAHARFGYPSVSLDQMLRWVAHWVEIGGPVLGKPTHFEERAGRF
jgi:nucleoside-diphosphate-sugar epimerase